MRARPMQHGGIRIAAGQSRERLEHDRTIVGRTILRKMGLAHAQQPLVW